MHPLLLQLGPLKLHTYGLMIVVGFLIGLYIIYKQAKVEGINADRIVDTSFWGLFFGLLGGRLFYIFTRLDYFSSHPLEIFYFWEGGLVFYGGFLGGATGFYIFTKKYKIPTLKAMDMAIPSLAIAHFFGRLGCFSAGCCFGRECDPHLPWAVVFKNPLTLAPLGIPIHPTQLYDGLNALLVFAVTYSLRNKKKFTGQLIVIYLLMYSVGRAIVEVYRGDIIRGFIIEPWLSTSQFLSIFAFAAGLYLWKTWSKKHPIKR